MLKLLKKNIRLFCLHLGFNSRRRSRNSTPIIVVKKSRKSTSNQNPHDYYNDQQQQKTQYPKSATVYPNTQFTTPQIPIRIATFNAALFSMAPAVVVPNDHKPVSTKSINDKPKSILKQSPLHPSTINNNNNSDGSLTRQQKYAKPKLRVSINLPDNEISLGRSRRVVGNDYDKTNNTITTTKLDSSRSAKSVWMSEGNNNNNNRAVVDVLRELNADILGLQDVKAEEGNEMKPLSDLAEALGMNYVFAESWAPEYGNAVLSKWPINNWSVHKIFDDSDFRNVLKTTIDVPQVGEVNFYCTHLDHLDENWRMKQINSIIESTNNEPHILAGGLNSLDEGDYSQERWIDIVKYYEEIGKPTPKAEVMRFLKHKQYTDAKDFGGECESVVMIAKGQSVQGTCKYGTRLDYILGSPSLEYKFVPGSYAVLSSKGTSDHHIVKVDILKKDKSFRETNTNKKLEPKKRVVKITQSSSKGIWSTDMR